MFETLLSDWKGEIQIDDKHYTSVQNATSVLNALSGNAHIILHPAVKNVNMSALDTLNEKIQYRVTVKKYMTEKSSPEFDFMAKWNHNNPMPMRTMTGTIEKETKGMVYMKLHGEAEPTVRCMRCGRTLTNHISMKYGIGPECITKIPFIMHLDVDDVEGIKKQLVNVVWEGWIIKSAITEREEKRC